MSASSSNSDRICMSPSSSSSASSCDTLDYDDLIVQTPSTFSSEKKSRSNSPPIFRIWNTIKATINGTQQTAPTGAATVIPASSASNIGKTNSTPGTTSNGLAKPTCSEC